jgi:hypothetical protein
MDLNRADKVEPDNHVTLRYPTLAFTTCALSPTLQMVLMMRCFSKFFFWKIPTVCWVDYL